MIEGTEPVDIRRLISPLRYDVVVRKRFFELLEANLSYYEEDFEGFLRLAGASAYGTWFERVFCWRFERALLENPEARRAAFADRVRRSADLYLGVRRHGLRPSSKLTLRTGKQILAAESGKPVSDAIFAGDGCHRLALLLLQGETHLAPGSYRIEMRPSYQPLDNTHLLLPGLCLTEAQYAEFLSWRYGRRKHQDLQDLLQEVKEKEPERLSELQTVVEADLPLVAGSLAGAKGTA